MLQFHHVNVSKIPRVVSQMKTNMFHLLSEKTSKRFQSCSHNVVIFPLTALNQNGRRQGEGMFDLDLDRNLEEFLYCSACRLLVLLE